MSEKITVYFPVWAEYSITVEVSDDGDRDEAIDAAVEEAYDKLPSGLCHQCTHGNDGKGFLDEHDTYLEIGDEMEAKYAIDSKGNLVFGDPDKEVTW